MISRPKFLLPVWLFVLLVSVYLTTMSGWIDSSDGQIMYQVTRSIIEERNFSIPDEPRFNGFYGTDGRKYSAAGLGISLASAPFYLVGKTLSDAFPDSDFARSKFTSDNYMTEFFVQMLNPVVMALIGVFLFLFLRRLSYSVKISVLSALIFAFSTVAWPYSKHFFATPTAVLMLLMSCFCIFHFRITKRLYWLVAGGAALGAAVMTYVSAGITAPAILVYLLLAVLGEGSPKRVRSRSLLLGLGSFSISFIGVLTLIASYNWLRFGNPFETGYIVGGQTIKLLTPMYLGLYGILFSPGKSIFLYSPPLILALVALPGFMRRYRDEAILFAFVFACNVAFYSKLNVWHAEWNWGLRYLFVVTPFSFLPIGYLLQSVADTGRFLAGKVVIPVMVLSGFAVQILGISVAYESYLARAPNSHTNLDYMYMPEAHFVPRYSPVVGHFTILRDELASLKDAVLEWREDYPKLAFGGGWHGLERLGQRKFRRAGGDATLIIFPGAEVPRSLTLTINDNYRDDGLPTTIHFYVNGMHAAESPVTLLPGEWQAVHIGLTQEMVKSGQPVLLRTIANTWRSEKTGGRDLGLAISDVAVDGTIAHGLGNTSWSHTGFPEKIELIHQTLDFWWVKVFFSDLPGVLLAWAGLVLLAAAVSAVQVLRILCGTATKDQIREDIPAICAQDSKSPAQNQ